MRAAVLREPGRPVEIETVRLDPPRAGEVQVRVAAAGVCHSDVHLADGVLGEGRWPMVLGHEGAGVVESVAPDVKHVHPVIASPSASCRRAGAAVRVAPDARPCVTSPAPTWRAGR